ncbi:MAG: hypothetical protein IJD82_06140 [Clostridia bacterium]|nr:hypothetical protein [Clostridia bacterium]
MRKSFVFLLCALLLFSGCAKYEEHTIVSFDDQSRITVENSETALSGELIVKEKKFSFEGNDIMLLDVTNETSKTYSVTINASFLDKNGTVLTTETQTFEQFYSGYQNYFIFEPQLTFDDFAYTVSTEVYEGVCYSKSFEMNLYELCEDERWPVDNQMKDLQHAILATVMTKNTGNQNIYYECRWLLLNVQGEVIRILTSHSDVNAGAEDYFSVPLYCAPEDEFVYPQELKGEIQFIVSLKSIRANG